jgi:hypothetical protein
MRFDRFEQPLILEEFLEPTLSMLSIKDLSVVFKVEISLKKIADWELSKFGDLLVFEMSQWRISRDATCDGSWRS